MLKLVDPRNFAHTLLPSHSPSLRLLYTTSLDTAGVGEATGVSTRIFLQGLLILGEPEPAAFVSSSVVSLSLPDARLLFLEVIGVAMQRLVSLFSC